MLAILRCGKYTLSLERPLIMGIVNVTPDSFSDGGRFLDPDAAIAHGRRLAADGAAILDIGGESTRPYADPVPVDEEFRRTIPVVAALAAEGLTVSVDTTKARIAAAAIDAGAVMVNDVSAGRDDPDLLDVVAESDVEYVLMHRQGTTQTMQDNPTYGDVVEDVHAWLATELDRLEGIGIARDRVIVDPGIGFGKTIEHNLALLADTRRFTTLGRPVLVGASRKSFLRDLPGATEPDGRLPASVAVASEVVRQGAAIVRVHDVAETVQAIGVGKALRDW
jgi:dihydropteroate synthase